MSNLLAYIYNDRCCEMNGSYGTPNGASFAPVDSGKTTISSSVGLRSTNIAPDVTNIQSALNRITPGYGGPGQPLVPSGVCDSKTVEAIQNFQLKHFGWKGADGKINPNGETLAKINDILASKQNPAPQVYPSDAQVVEDVFKDTIQVYLVEARRWVHETRMELMALEPFVDSLDTNSETYDRLNNVFAIEQSASRSATLRKILRVYDDMERAFQSRENAGGGVFELYRGKATGANNKGAIIAFTVAAGFYMNGSESNSFEFGTTRNDRIYLMPSGMVYFAAADSTFYKSVLIHELAHFVGGWHSVGTIEDWSHKGTLLERLRSANCYQLYAREVHFQTSGK